jgi:hypothetical protein
MSILAALNLDVFNLDCHPEGLYLGVVDVVQLFDSLERLSVIRCRFRAAKMSEPCLGNSCVVLIRYLRRGCLVILSMLDLASQSWHVDVALNRVLALLFHDCNCMRVLCHNVDNGLVNQLLLPNLPVDSTYSRWSTSSDSLVDLPARPTLSRVFLLYLSHNGSIWLHIVFERGSRCLGFKCHPLAHQ